MVRRHTLQSACLTETVFAYASVNITTIAWGEVLKTFANQVTRMYTQIGFGYGRFLTEKLEITVLHKLYSYDFVIVVK